VATTANSPRTLLGTAKPAAARRGKPAGARAAAKLAEPPEEVTEPAEAPEPSLPALERYQAMDAAVLASHPEWVYLFAERQPPVSRPHVISDEEYAEFQGFRARLARGDLCERSLRRMTAAWETDAARRVHLPRPPFTRVPLAAETPSEDAADHAPASSLESPPEAAEPPLKPLPEETP
jgi:hypothetical protein